MKSEEQNNKPKKSKSLKNISFSKLVLAAFVAAFAVVGSYLLIQSMAKPPAPTVYLNPETQTLPGSTNFSVQVRVDSGTTAVNAVQANFSYPATLVDFVSISTAGTAFPVDAPSSGGSGQVSIARGIIGSVTGDQLVATVNFRTKTTSGAASMAFTTGTALVSASTNQNMLASLSATGGATYTVDLTIPTVSVTAPANGTVITLGSSTNITATATDNNGIISRIEFLVDGVLRSTDTSSPYSFSWSTTGVSLGNHTISAKAYDPSGNVATSPTVTVSVADRTAPSAPGSFRTTGSTLNSISLAWNASTDDIGVTGYRISRNGTVINTTTATTLQYTDTGLAGATTYSYTIVALDAAGNVSTAASVSAATRAFTPGDIDRNGAVDITDLSILLTRWGTTDAASDLNTDGAVNILDLSVLLTNYGQ